MKKLMTLLICAFCCMSVNAQKVETKDLIGQWKYVAEEGTTMVGDIEMTILPAKASQVLYFGNGGAKMPSSTTNIIFLTLLRMRGMERRSGNRSLAISL
ncbi:MAG: hypothetical protein J6T52_06095 [Bacteroidaceae bacterium]|nr:hypothetical protein [Bacteroidaceae bacterium]